MVKGSLGGNPPAGAALQQKDEYIRNQRQLLAWAAGDVKELQAEKKALARQRDLLEEQVQARGAEEGGGLLNGRVLHLRCGQRFFF